MFRLKHNIIFIAKNKGLYFIIFWAFILQVLAGTAIIYQIFTTQTRQNLDGKIENIKEDLVYENGKWDIDSYNKNPDLLGLYPLYIITTDGFVLDRRAPIHGFLDTSDFKRLLSFDTAQTYTSITNQTWRIYIKKIEQNKSPLGVVAVSYYNPSEELLEKIDKKLVANANFIHSKIKIKERAIDVSEVNVKQIDYDISFTIIDNFNTILGKTANVNNTKRIPNFIDPSYVKAHLNNSQEKIITDSQTGELFLTRRSILVNKQGPFGIVIIGQSITPLLTALKQYLLWSGLSSFIIGISCMIGIHFLVAAKKIQAISSQQFPQKIVFSQKRGVLIIDGTDIEVPYATNQFYLLQALFSNPTKRWETDELLERFGENHLETNSRKVYDSMISVNKKVATIIPLKLILNQNKTYQLNPLILASKQ